MLRNRQQKHTANPLATSVKTKDNRNDIFNNETTKYMTEAFFELPFFTNLLILLVSAKLLGELFERYKQPSMIGEIFITLPKI